MSSPAGDVIDLLHGGRPHVIGAWVLDDVVVDPGPSSCLPRLLPALEANPPRALALTHIHLDHAGASGSLVRRFPDLEVWVHERGAPHMSDPSRLLASAGRLYGDQMERLWGEMLPVPEDRLRVLRGGERIGPFEVAYTPGHASHHVSYMHEASRRVFTGDVTGVRIDGGPVMPPTPPPDIDIPAWRRSLELIESWQPSSIAFTHFGESGDVGGHLRSLREHLDVVERLAGELDEEGFMAQLGTHLRELVGTELAETYARAMPPEQSYAGLARYIAKRDAAES